MASYTARKDKSGQVISYQIKVSRGRDKLTGKQLTPFTTTYTPPEGWSTKAIERGLAKAMTDFQAACDRGEVLTKEQERAQELERLEQSKRERTKEAQKVTFSKYVDIFMKEAAATRALGTLENYRLVFKKASAVFGEMKMEDITNLMLKQYIIDVQTIGQNDFNGKLLGHKTVVKHYGVLRVLFENAKENKVISVNPMRDIKRPKPRPDEVKKQPIVYDEKQVKYIFECLNKEPLKWRALVIFALDTGCRRGEIVGLRWEEIDFKTGKVNICRNAQYTHGKGTYITTPKNRKSRTIYLNAPALKVLAEWRKEQVTLHLGQGIPLSGYCFTREDGQMLNPQEPTSYLTRFGKKYNLPGIHPHSLRHTMATLTIANGGDVVSVSSKLGHADPAITLRVYSHANEQAQLRANEVLADAIYGGMKK